MMITNCFRIIPARPTIETNTPGQINVFFVSKKILIKKFIFYHIPIDKKDNTKKFALYSLMGVFTTIIFWGVEIAFDTLSQDPNAKYLGAVIGLSIGYVIKYFLDKKYVFIYKEKLTV